MTGLYRSGCICKSPEYHNPECGRDHSVVQRIDEEDQEIWDGSRIKISLTAFILCHRDGLFWSSSETNDRNIVLMDLGYSWMIWLDVWFIVGISITSRTYAGMGSRVPSKSVAPWNANDRFSVLVLPGWILLFENVATYVWGEQTKPMGCRLSLFISGSSISSACKVTISLFVIRS